MYGYYGYDWTMILVAAGAVLCMLASMHVNTTYTRYSRMAAACGLTGADVARLILERNGVTDVQVQHISGNLTDHYDPSKQVVNLSDAVYGSRTVAALGVAAHECGHVMQHEEGYTPLQFRTALVPIANFGSNAGIWIVLLSLILGLSSTLTTIGIVLFSMGVLFQLVTLPVEFNASHRALVAAAASSILQLLRLVLLSNRRNRND